MARFTVNDVFGRVVVGPFSAWDHILQRHPEMADKEDLVKDTITAPVTVHETSDAARRLFRGKTITDGFWKGSFACVIIEYDKADVGYVRTAYLATLEPRGKVLWP